MRFSGLVLPGSTRSSCVALLALSLGLGLASGCGGARRAEVRATELEIERESAEPAAADPGGVLHVVEDGQTLWRIARVYGVELDELAAVNRITDPAELEIGQRVFVPRAGELLHVPPYPQPLTADSPATRVAGTGSFDWPVSGGRLLSGYGASRPTHRHAGIDIGGEPGQPVRAAAPGRVVYSGSTMRGYGKTIIIAHGDDLKSLYAHNSALLADEGSWVERGEAIARVGRTGNASTEHCHFEIRRDDTPVDPLPYFQPPTEGSR